MKACNSNPDTKDSGNKKAHSNTHSKSDEIWQPLCDWLNRGQYDFPPKLTPLHAILLGASWFFSIAALCYLLLRFCTNVLSDYEGIVCDYFAIFILPLGLFADRYIRKEKVIHRLRLQDHSEVEALFVEAGNVEHRLKGTDVCTYDPKSDRTNFSDNRKKLCKEVERLNFRPEIWTEYEILNLEQLLVEFLKIEELKERARSELDDLEEYASDSKVSYDLRKYDRWEDRIDTCIEKIDKCSRTNKDCEPDDEERDRNAESLRAAVKTLQEHIASYSKSWAEGSLIVRSLIICCGVAIPIFVALGTLPWIHPSLNAPERILQFYNWGYLGTSGSLTAVVLALRKSDVTEVGVTEGKRELWQMVIGTALGFVAGILVYSMISAGKISGEILPTLTSSRVDDFGRSVLLAFTAGFASERVYDKVKTDVSSG